MKRKRKYMIRRLVIFSSMAVLLFLAILLVSRVFKSVPDSVALFNSSNKIYVSGEANIVDGIRDNSESNLDGTKIALMTNFVQDSGGTLWYVTLSNKTKIADNVIYFKNSDSGNGIAYLKSSKNDYKELYLYDSRKNKSTLVTSSAYYNESDSVSKNLCISPDGKAVGYIADHGDYPGAKISGRMKQLGKPEVIFEDSYCVAISNDAKYVYFVRSNNDMLSLVVRNDNTDTMLVSEIKSTIFLNNDFSQCIFSYDGASYISKEGKTKEKLADTEVFSFVLPHSNHSFNFYDRHAGFYIDSKPLKSFANTFFSSPEKNLMYIKSDYDVSEITGNILDNSAILAINKGKEIVFIDKSNFLCSVTKDSDSKKTISQDAVSFDAYAGSSSVYFVTSNNELWYAKTSAAPKKIADNVLPQNLFVSNSANTVFFLTNYNSNSGMLLSSKNGGKAVEIDNGVNRVDMSEKSVYYRKITLTGAYDVFKSNGGTKFKKIAEGII